MPTRDDLEMPTEALPDPHLEPHRPRQLAWKLLDDAGLTYFFRGPGTAQDVFAALCNEAPVLRLSEIARNGALGTIPDRADFAWTAVQDTTRAVIAISCFPEADGQWLMRMNIGAFTPAPPPNRWGIGTRHAHVPVSVAATIRNGEYVDLQDLVRLAPARPSPSLQE